MVVGKLPLASLSRALRVAAKSLPCWGLQPSWLRLKESEAVPRESSTWRGNDRWSEGLLQLFIYLICL